MAIDLRNAEPETPEWWLRRLLHRLEYRRAAFDRWERYYSGNHPLSFFDAAFRDKFGDRFRRFASNFTALVVDGLAERLEVQGFRFKDAKGDADLWAIWQENDLDGGSQMAHTEALVKGIAYALVEPRADGGTPRITVESPLDCIVELDARDHRRRRAALKRWIDDSGRLVTYVYTPEFIFKYQSVKAWPDPMDGWPWNWDGMLTLSPEMVPAGGFEMLEVPDEEWPLRNRLGVVPVVPLPNQPRLNREGRSEIEPIASNQDLINYYRAMAVVAARYLAVPQRWVKNLEAEIDPVTKLPLPPFKSGLADLWMVPPYDPDDPRAEQAASAVDFGQFPAADVAPYLRSIDAEVGAMASISRMPYHYLLGQPQAIPPSGESLKSSEAGLVRKSKRTSIYLGEGWEETMRTALRAMNDERADMRTAATLWANPETTNPAVLTDSVIKQYQANLIDREAALEALDYAPDAIARMKPIGTTKLPSQEQIEMVGALVRAGFDAQAALMAVGLNPILHEGFLPVTLQAEPPNPAAVPTNGPPMPARGA